MNSSAGLAYADSTMQGCVLNPVFPAIVKSVGPFIYKRRLDVLVQGSAQIDDHDTMKACYAKETKRVQEAVGGDDYNQAQQAGAGCVGADLTDISRPVVETSSETTGAYGKTSDVSLSQSTLSSSDIAKQDEIERRWEILEEVEEAFGFSVL